MTKAHLASWALVCSVTAPLLAADPYEIYVKTSKDFQRVKQDKDFCLKAWPGWTYMPWTYKWTIGYDDAAGRWALEHGYNGAFLDHGQTKVGGADKLAWIDRFRLRFYVDHAAGKGDLYLRDRGGDKLPTTGLRTVVIDQAFTDRLKGRITQYAGNVKSSPNRAAYALDDEVSWGSFVKPCFWRLNEDRAAYDAWLKEVHGPAAAPKHPGWVNYDAIRGRLAGWAVKDFDCSQVMDQLSYNDSVWANLLGELVEHANRVDPSTPCGFVGGQQPSAFGGYDYGRLMRKIQFIEAYNYGDSQAIIRSLNPHNALPLVTTHFHKTVPDTIWQTWYYLAQGNRGFIGWVEGWFDGNQPAAWHKAVAPHYLEAGKKIGPLGSGAEWVHDGVAIYYNHCSVQLNWILDAEAHKATWPRRFSDAVIGGGHLARKAWANMLRDSGIQFNFLDYVTVIQSGVPAEYKVLILPATIALSDVEAARIRDFCRAGGTVIADYLPGLWDQHGRGRKTGGALDDVFGLRHDPLMKAGDVFGRKFWTEVDQDAHYTSTGYDDFLANNSCLMDPSGFNKAVRNMRVDHAAAFGRGRAVLMNLSPVWYNAYRTRGPAAAAKREVFMKHLRQAGVNRWVELTGPAGDALPESAFGYEITCWSKGAKGGSSARQTTSGLDSAYRRSETGRTILFLVLNPETHATMTGGGNSVGLKTDKVDVVLKFAAKVSAVRNERTGATLPDGTTFPLAWTMNEAAVVSFQGPPPR